MVIKQCWSVKMRKQIRRKVRQCAVSMINCAQPEVVLAIHSAVSAHDGGAIALSEKVR